ncbi:MAG: succinate-semialdehyde dehydrogenase / glutarate-semialdehyde dehydrogenase [Acidobacteriota bacterium]|jgi:succinate-semialdehyde dehydrogenase/glutarate-semialdehyde dehydrogenase|nr:succinate-semialdehyde dehydrogenase / glutarate-semialdehyde dehydrogenase [Acidobacteriota bacterium]
MPIATINPATGETLKEFAPLTDREIDVKLGRAVEAFQSHRRTSFAERAGKLLRAAEILESEKDVFARLMTVEMGKPIKSAREEAAKCAWVCRYYAEHAEQFLADEIVETSATRSFVRYQPIGVVLAVMPWNFPFWQVIRFAAPALAAGNVGVLKHASNVPQCALAIEDIFRRAGFDRGEFQTLLITSDQVNRVLEDKRVAAATLTGSEHAGASVASTAGKLIKKTVLELGGSDPFIVMPSANLDEAVKTAVKARTINNGQSCIAAKRFIVHEKIYDKFARRMKEGMAELKVGDPLDEATEIGPLATAQIVRDIEGQMSKTVAAGARAFRSPVKMPERGFYFAPTVLEDIPENSPGYCEEFFAPVALLFRVASVVEAIRIANDTPFGLGASAWTNEATERERFASEIESGSVFINAMVASDPRLPFGGTKRSGYGRELSAFGIREFVNIKTVYIMDDEASRRTETE